MRKLGTLQVLLILCIVTLVIHTVLGWFGPTAWRWGLGGALAGVVLAAIHVAIVVMQVLALSIKWLRERIELVIFPVVVEAVVLIYYGTVDPTLRLLLAPGFALLALGAGIILANGGRSGNGFWWLTSRFVFHFSVPIALLAMSGLAFLEWAVPRGWSEGFAMAGGATFLYAAGNFLIYERITRKNRPRSAGTSGGEEASKPVEYAKSYHEALRLTANALVVSNGVLLALINSWTDFYYRSLVVAVLAGGLLLGIFHLNVLVSGISAEYTKKVTTTEPPTTTDVTNAYVAVLSVHNAASELLLNLQFYSILIAVALIATRLI